ncbi:J domain-containing protein [Gloeocapsa sp. PCC 73106]|uniref:J domain-containing protein n=1 Tax=Gloeocapsa sp. PCC 73106 TaxID=102232 RepID=UPI00130EFC4B|nr:J domain-containing protein [Gloeocapsa sp. PCC 73106]
MAYSVGTMGIGLCLFLIFFGVVCWFFFTLEAKPVPRGEYCELACLWEDAPQSALKGQSYHLATPFASIFIPTWHHFYRSNLGKPEIDYWEWRSFPASDSVCPELTALLASKSPNTAVKSILLQLASAPVDPFQEGDFGQQIQNYLLFKDWHQASYHVLGEKSLAGVYQVCFNTSWDTIKQILGQREGKWWQVLNVNPEATVSEVEQAYKLLIRHWHPDLNSSPHSHQMAIMINSAYQDYKSLSPVRSLSPFFSLLYKIYTFFSSLKLSPLLKVRN